jgi:UDP-N-acetylmuramoylalanine--D-glutamate ligase
MLHLKDRRVLVLGLGDTGLSCARWLVRRGAHVSVADTRAEPPHARALASELPGVPLTTGAFEARTFARADAIALSPGIDRRDSHIAHALRRGVPVVGDVELFAQALPHIAAARGARHPRVLAITGSNGKSTVTAMTGEACRATGRPTLVAGNIGLPVLDALTAIEDGAPLPEIFVLELSSFQLESTASLEPDAATVLNLSEDHLDRYNGIADYAAAKARIFAGNGVQVLNRLDAWSLAMGRPGRRIVTFGADAPRGDSEWGVRERGGASLLAYGADDLIPIAQLRVPGLHNAVNALAALALARALALPLAPLLEGLKRFGGLPHRLQPVGEVCGIVFYDDSKGTNVGATIAALSGMSVPVTLIAGGDGKGQNFAPLAPAIKAHARALVLIGRDADAIAAVIRGSGVPIARANSMEEAVEAAYRASSRGDAVLLSPACASYDMFRSYVHRGEAFAQAVRALARREEGR